MLACYLLIGASAVLARLFIKYKYKHKIIQHDLFKIPKPTEPATPSVARHFKDPLHKLILFLLCGTIFLPRQPWRQLTSTLLYDLVFSISSVVITKTIRVSMGEINTATSPFGDSYYNAAKDPHYISNLDSPIDPFIVQALNETNFTNIVHVVLESIRMDSFPWDEQGILHNHLRKNFEKPRNATPITTSNITPFIHSLAANTLAFETVYSVCPLSHKSKIGCTSFFVLADLVYCGQLPLPLDFTVEMEEPAKMYQTCLPQVFRHINSVGDKESEVLSVFDQQQLQTVGRAVGRTADHWETIVAETSAGEFDHLKRIFQYAGFDAAITADELGRIHEISEYDHTLGFFDDLSLDFIWRYVDNARRRSPKNRMFIGWVTTTTHCPFIVPPKWANESSQSYVKDNDQWHSVNAYLNALRWTDDKIQELITGFRSRGLEEETLFVM